MSVVTEEERTYYSSRCLWWKSPPTIDRGRSRLGLLKGFLEFPSLVYPELLLLGGALLKFGIAALRFLELGLQPGHLVPLLLELGLVRFRAGFLLGCAEIAN